MKKILLSLIFLLVGLTGAFAQFTAGNLAVYRYGDGTPMVLGAYVPVFIDEYTQAGVFVRTTSITPVAVGAHYGLKGLGLTSPGGVFEAEGYPVLSRDGSTLSIIGYNAANPLEFVIATIDAGGTVNTTTLVDATDAIGTPRSAVVEGSAVYFNGYQGGVRYKTFGTITPSIRVSSAQTAPRVLTIAQISLGAGPTVETRIFAPIGSTSIASNVLTTTANTVFGTTPNIPGGAPLVAAHQAIVLKSTSGRTLMYVLDDNAGSPVIKKYRSNAAGIDWVALGSANVAVGTKSLAGTYNAATGVKLFFTTLGTPGVAGSSKLFTLSDSFTGATEASVNLAGTPTLLASAASDVTFRGVAMAPGTSILPVSLTSFTGKATTNGAQLAWQTASEHNNDHFEVLRAVDGSEFKTIGTVKGAGNTTDSKNYIYLDRNATAGANYYQLKQVDNDGTATLHEEVVSVKLAFAKADLTASFAADKQEITITVNAAAAGNGTIKIYSTSGQLVASKEVKLSAGFSSFTISASNLAAGVYIANVNLGNQTLSKKFIK